MDEFEPLDNEENLESQELPSEQDEGETAVLPSVTTVSMYETETILVILTTVFLIFAILLTSIKRYTSYGIGKSPVELKKKKKAM